MTVGPGRRTRAETGHIERAAELAERIRNSRRAAAMTQQQLASQAGVALWTPRETETGLITHTG